MSETTSLLNALQGAVAARCDSGAPVPAAAPPAANDPGPVPAPEGPPPSALNREPASERNLASLFDRHDAAPSDGAKARSARKSTSLRSAEMLEGHRTRLRARFDRGDTLDDYELLELVLFRAIPRRDTKPIAKAMIAKFGSFAEAIAAPAARLTEIEGVGARVVSDMRVVRASADRFALTELRNRQTLSSTDAVADYYRTKLKSAEREEFHILFLDKRNRFIASECAGVGTVDHTPVYPREVIARALTHGATAVVLVHNHPSGDPTPSRADITMTEQIIRATAAVDVSVHDHIIIAGHGYLSMRGEGLI